MIRRNGRRMSWFVVMTLLAASSVHLAAQEPVKVHVFGQTESVADFQKSVTNKFAKTMTLVPSRADAHLAIEIEGRDTVTFGRKRSVALAVHYAGITDKLLRYPTGRGGGFRMTAGLAAIADETMKLIDDWLKDNRNAITGAAPSSALKMPLRLFVIADDIEWGDPATQATGAEELGTERDHAAVAAPLLTPLLGNGTQVELFSQPGVRTSVGMVAAHSLVKLGATDALFTTLASARSDSARADAARVLDQIGDQPALSALATALQKDSSGRVRRAAVTTLGSWPSRDAVDPLITALGDRDANVRKDAAAALQKLTQQNFGVDAERWRAWWAQAKGGN